MRRDNPTDLCNQPTNQPLRCVAVEARGLKGKKLETYAKVYLDKEKKFKTNRIKNSADPTWSEDPRLLYVNGALAARPRPRPRPRLRVSSSIERCLIVWAVRVVDTQATERGHAGVAGALRGLEEGHDHAQLPGPVPLLGRVAHGRGAARPMVRAAARLGTPVLAAPTAIWRLLFVETDERRGRERARTHVRSSEVVMLMRCYVGVGVLVYWCVGVGVLVCWYVGRYALESKKGEERGEIHLQVCYLPVSVDMTPEREEFTYPLHTMIRNNRFETFERIIQHSTCASEQTNKSSIERARACGCAAASRYSSSVWMRE